ncbi:MAG: endonuclease [Bacilli bacterium]|nr:endonuclease [Bacilli bacterium]
MNKIKRNILLIGLVSSFSLLGAASLPISSSETPSGPRYETKLPTTIDLNDSTEAEIRDYYSSLNPLEASERNGNNLLKNLKPILQDFDYYTYDNVWKIYEITDRDWNLSPAASDNANGITYDSSTNTYTKYSYLSNAKSDAASNPYVHTLYRNVDENGSIVEAGRIKEWGDHNASGTNREHVWCQSRGFKAPSGAEGPAGTDVHHLISGDGLVNQSYHNNNPYGFVKKDDASTKNAGDQKAWLNGNYLGPQLHTHSEDQANVVFEPQDSDKGDIARALFYMAACYNNFSGTDIITDYNPNLLLVDYATDNGAAESSSATHPVCMGILSDLLEWHKMDPVDEYEIHRNNLIYKNFQHNRNPFIDFPEWVDVVWGNKANLSANPATDKISSGQKGPITVTPSTLEFNLDEADTRKEGIIKVKADIDDELVCEVKDETLIEVLRTGTYTTDGINETHYNVIAKGKTGSTTITFKGHKDGQEVSATCTVTIHETEKTPEPEEPKNPFIEALRGVFGDAAETVFAIIIVVIVVIVLAILILALLMMSKKNRKKVIKKATKAVKKSYKRRK